MGKAIQSILKGDINAAISPFGDLFKNNKAIDKLAKIKQILAYEEENHDL